MLENVLIFLAFLTPLIFFHELGHFLFARWAGVKVEVFSIGFGPKLFSWRDSKGTDFTISALPLGGYVKMFGDNPLARDAIPKEERAVSFVFKTNWQKFWIVFGGPLANFILSFVIFFGILCIGEKVPEVQLYAVAKNKNAKDIGFQDFDVLKKVNNTKIHLWKGIGETKTISQFTVEREGKEKIINANIKNSEFMMTLQKIQWPFRSPVFLGQNGQSYLIMQKNSNYHPSLTLELELDMKFTGEYKIYSLISDNVEENVKNLQKLNFKTVTLKGSLVEKLEFLRTQMGLYTKDIFVSEVIPDGSAKKSGLLKGDVIVEFNRSPIYSFMNLRNLLQASKDAVSLGVIRKGKRLTLDLLPKEVKMNGKTLRQVGVVSGGIYASAKTYRLPFPGVIQGIQESFSKTLQMIFYVFTGFVKLFTGEVSINNIGGPLTIGKVAVDTFAYGIDYFLKLMALFSINLGLINLFPIPVLDGGHIAFILIETIRGEPLSRSKLEFAHKIGASLLFMLMLFAIFKDITRIFWKA